MRRGNLIAERVRRGWTQRQVAEMLDVSKQAVCNWESGRARPISDKAVELSELLGCPLKELLAFTDEKAGA